jgi:hypothetical protein
MELVIKRDDRTPDRTIGRLFVDGALECFTLEDAVRVGPKVPAATAIPSGRYRVILAPSQRFGRMLPYVLGVPCFNGIMFHAGNTAIDTSGCILVGQSRAHDSIASSRLALNALQPKIAAELAGGRDVWLTIENAPAPAAPVRQAT